MKKTVGLRELRQNASGLVRQAEAGEDIIVTVSGRPVVRLVAVGRGRWRRFEDIAELFQGPSDPYWERDRSLIDGSLRAP